MKASTRKETPMTQFNFFRLSVDGRRNWTVKPAKFRYKLFYHSLVLMCVTGGLIAEANLYPFVLSQQTEDLCHSSQLITAYGQQNHGHNNGSSQIHEKHQSKEESNEKVLSLQVGRDIFTQNQLDIAQRLFFGQDTYHNTTNCSELNLYGSTTKAHAMVFNELLFHRYDNINELRESTGPEVDNDRCVSQLSELVERSRLAAREKYSSRDINLLQLLDTFGRAPSGIIMGNLFWPGMYDECLKLKIITNANERLDTRYCLAGIKHKQWPKDSPYSVMLAIDIGICLPKSCDSLRYKNKYPLIQQLIDFNFRSMDKDEMEINSIYCLPDENSPLRAWWKSPKALQAAIMLAIWISILIYATLQYELFFMKRDKRDHCSSLESKSRKSNQGERERQQVTIEDNFQQIYKMLSITHNLELLCGSLKKPTGRRSSDEVGPKGEDTLIEDQKTDDKPIVNLRCLEGIKVICMCYLIMGHMLMCLNTMVSNVRVFSSDSSLAFLWANMMPAFGVNSFFTITGILTSYLMFKQNKTHSFITSPVKWLALMIYRYLRIMPMYLIVVYYCKYLAKYTGHGPAWDYGTSSLALRRQCEQESWLWTLMFGANFKHPLEHCIPSAWYLADDFQFFMVTPIFLVALHKSPLFGQRLLKAGILAGYLAGIWSILSSDAPDLRPVARFWPHGFKTYVTFLTSSYTWPQYRIPAYLCGLLFGYMLYTYEQDKLKFKQAAELGQVLRKPEWSPIFMKYGMKLSLSFVTFCALAPVIGTHVHLDKLLSKVMVAIFMSTNHIVVALAAGFYILLATTGFGSKYLNNFLSASIFRSLGRLSLCVALINVEVCYYLVLSHKRLKYVDFTEHTALNLLGIVASYSVATVIYISFEAPIKSAVNQVLARLMVRAVEPKRKVN